MCCPPIPLHRPCPEWGQELKVALNSTCDEARGALKVNTPSPTSFSYTIILVLPLVSLPGVPQGSDMWGLPLPGHVFLTFSFLLQNLLFSVCGLTICAAIICTLSAIVCCVQIFSLDLVHMVRRETGPKQTGLVGAWSVCWDWACK